MSVCRNLDGGSISVFKPHYFMTVGKYMDESQGLEVLTFQICYDIFIRKQIYLMYSFRGVFLMFDVQYDQFEFLSL